jgi:glycosyltransferase involved in cell wall biosynthesis
MVINKIPKNFKRFIPTSIKRLMVRIYLRYFIMRNGPGGFESPRINFAGVLPPEGSFVRGGKVKLTYLRKRWGEYKKNFNILYLVSSTLPAYPDIWVNEARRVGIKVFWNQNGIGVPAWTEKWREINKTMLPLNLADYVAYQSNFSKSEADDLVTKASGLYSIITNSCDVQIFKPAEINPPERPFRIMVMGTAMTPEKVMIPLEALKILTERGFDAELRSYGPVDWDNAEEEIETKAREWGILDRVKRRGKYLQNEAPELYREGHVYVHTKHMDSSPSAILEAMASGLPVIAGKTGGPNEWITPAAGITLPVPYSREKLLYPSPTAVADAIEEISKDWPKWSKGARENAVNNFSNEDWLNAHAEAFRKIGVDVE